MITYKVGDLLEVKKGILAHGCNTQGAMGSGVARLVKEKYPGAYASYVRDLDAGYGLGDVSFWSPLGLDDKSEFFIANALTQVNMGSDGKKYVSYDAVDRVFQTLTRAAQMGIYEIHIPKIGAGLGGGDWGVISAIIQHRCKDVNVIVWELP